MLLLLALACLLLALAFLLLALVLLLLALVLPLSALVLQAEGSSLTRSIPNYGIVIPETIHASNHPSSHHGTVCIQSRLLYITPADLSAALVCPLFLHICASFQSLNSRLISWYCTGHYSSFVGLYPRVFKLYSCISHTLCCYYLNLPEPVLILVSFCCFAIVYCCFIELSVI